jgi:hypothetical protein
MPREFNVGDRVMTNRGPGTIFSKSPEPNAPGCFNYGVQLDDGNSDVFNPCAAGTILEPLGSTANINFPLPAGTQVKLIDGRTGILQGDVGGINVSVPFKDDNTGEIPSITGGMIAEVLSIPETQDIIMTRKAVQYGSSSDFQAASKLANALGWELIFDSNLNLNEFSDLIVVGGQFANPLYAQFVAEGIFRNLTEADTGIQIQVRQKGDTKIYGVAGWSGNDTLASAQYIVDVGLPEADVSIPSGMPGPPEKTTSYRLDVKVGFLAPVAVPLAQLSAAINNAVSPFTGTTIQSVEFDGVDTISIHIIENSPLQIAVIVAIIAAIAFILPALGGFIKSWELVNLSTNEKEKAETNANVYEDCINAGGTPSVCAGVVKTISQPTLTTIPTTTPTTGIFGLGGIGNLIQGAIPLFLLIALLRAIPTGKK